MAEVELPNAEELEEVKGKTFTKRVALTTAIFAVALAITSLGGNKAMKEMLLTQQQASDQWGFYQAKVLREHIYRSQKLRLEIDLMERENRRIEPEVKEKLESLLKKMADEEARFNAEKKEIEKEAKKLEHERDMNRGKDPYFEYGEVLLQIAIVMASVFDSIRFPSGLLFCHNERLSWGALFAERILSNHSDPSLSLKAYSKGLGCIAIQQGVAISLKILGPF